jgi:mycothiol synthase
MMKNVALSGPDLFAEPRALVKRLGVNSTITDFEEHVQMKAVRDSLHRWHVESEFSAFAYVDEYANLWFEVAPGCTTMEIEIEIIDWGAQIQKRRNIASGVNSTLDHTCEAANHQRVELLTRSGFVQQNELTLLFSRKLTTQIEEPSFPTGYTWRNVLPSDSVQTLVDLHRAAFGTDKMTVELRQAIMNSPQYEMDLDLLAVAPDGSLAGFCICSIDEENKSVGYTDPIGIHPLHQHKGLAQALVTAGISLLAKRGVKEVKLGTSSENTAMQLLANALKFSCYSEKIWFSKNIM